MESRCSRRSRVTFGSEVVTITRRDRRHHEDELAAVPPGVVAGAARASDRIHQPYPYSRSLPQRDRPRGTKVRFTQSGGNTCRSPTRPSFRYNSPNAQHLSRRHQHLVAAEVDALRILRPARAARSPGAAPAPAGRTARCSASSTRVSSADSTWLLPVLYSIVVPGSAMSGWRKRVPHPVGTASPTRRSCGRSWTPGPSAS